MPRGTEERGVGSVAERLQAAMNAHDLAQLVEIFAEDYRSEQPVHPGRGFDGRDQVRTNWSAIFAEIPDFRAELLRSCAGGGVEWSEWRWTGTRADGTALELVGVTVLGVREGDVAWARLYLEPVDRDGEDIDTTVRRMTRPTSERA